MDKETIIHELPIKQLHAIMAAIVYNRVSNVPEFKAAKVARKILQETGNMPNDK